MKRSAEIRRAIRQSAALACLRSGRVCSILDRTPMLADERISLELIRPPAVNNRVSIPANWSIPNQARWDFLLGFRAKRRRRPKMGRWFYMVAVCRRTGFEAVSVILLARLFSTCLVRVSFQSVLLVDDALASKSWCYSLRIPFSSLVSWWTVVIRANRLRRAYSVRSRIASTPSSSPGLSQFGIGKVILAL